MIKILFLLFSITVGNVVLVETHDGERLKGTLLETNDKQVVIDRNGTLITFDKTAVFAVKKFPTTKTTTQDTVVIELSEYAKALKKFAQTPRGRPKNYLKTWRTLGSDQLKTLSTLKAGDQEIEAATLTLMLRYLSGNNKIKGLTWFLAWSKTPELKRAQTLLDNMNIVDSVAVHIEILRSEFHGDTAKFRQTLETRVRSEGKPGALKALSSAAIACLKSAPADTQPSLARILGSGTFSLTRADWRRILDHPTSSIRGLFLKSIYKSKVQPPDMALVIERLTKGENKECEFSVLLIGQQNPAPLMNKDVHRSLWQIGTRSDQEKVLSEANRLLRIQTGNIWPLKAKQWTKYFDDK